MMSGMYLHLLVAPIQVCRDVPVEIILSEKEERQLRQLLRLRGSLPLHVRYISAARSLAGHLLKQAKLAHLFP